MLIYLIFCLSMFMGLSRVIDRLWPWKFYMGEVIIWTQCFWLTTLVSLAVLLLSFLWEAMMFIKHYRPLSKLLVVDSYRPSESHREVKTRIAHWSDLHLTAGDDINRIEDGSPGGNLSFKKLLSMHRQQLIDEIDCILITGDITDGGRGEEWQSFIQILGEKLQEKTLIVPGNHDINIPPRILSALDDDSKNIMLLRCMLAIDRVQGNRAVILDEAGKPITLSSLMSGASIEINEYLTLCNKKERNENEKERWRSVQTVPQYLIDNAFPMAVSIPSSELIIIILNSNDSATSVLTNAFGSIGVVQLQKLSALRSLFKNQPHLVALHHHLSNKLIKTIDEGGVIEVIKQSGMAVYDAQEFLAALIEDPALVLNGHRHVDYFANVSDLVQLISAPSTTLGDEAAKAGDVKRIGFRVWGLSWDEGGPPTVQTSAIIRV